MYNVKINNRDIIIPIQRYVIYRDKVKLIGDNIKDPIIDYINNLTEDDFIRFTEVKEEVEEASKESEQSDTAENDEEKVKTPEEPIEEEPVKPKEFVSKDLPGIKIYDENNHIVEDCTGFIYKWNIYTEYDNGIMLTKSETDREVKPLQDTPEPEEIVDPLNNDELTECVADLMYEMGCNSLGL